MLQANQLVNKVGKYLYRGIDGREKIKFTGNTCDVYITVYYQIPVNKQNPADNPEVNDLHEMRVNVNITTYQNKIRVNVIAVTPEEKTLGYDLYHPDEVKNIAIACDKIYKKVCMRIAKAFKDFDFLF